MNSLRDQFSAASKAQFDAQFAFFHSMANQALDSAGRLASLNLAVSHDALQRSLGTSFALMSARDPREVLALGGQAGEQMRNLFSYSQELLGIASGVRPYALLPALARPQAPQLAIETVEVVEHQLAKTVADTVADAAPAAAAPEEAPAADDADAAPATGPEAAILAAVAPATEPVVVAEPEPAPASLAAVAAPVPVAEPKPIAKAAGKGMVRAATAPHPAAAPLAAAAAGEQAETPKLVTPPHASKRKK